jgi:hypothetical protein
MEPRKKKQIFEYEPLIDMKPKPNISVLSPKNVHNEA